MYLNEEKDYLTEVISEQFVKKYPEVQIPSTTPKVKLDYTTWRITTMQDLIYDEIMKKERIAKTSSEPLSLVIKEFKNTVKKLKSRRQSLKPSNVLIGHKRKINRTLPKLLMDPTVRIAVKKINIIRIRLGYGSYVSNFPLAGLPNVTI